MKKIACALLGLLLALPSLAAADTNYSRGGFEVRDEYYFHADQSCTGTLQTPLSMILTILERRTPRGNAFHAFFLNHTDPFNRRNGGIDPIAVDFAGVNVSRPEPLCVAETGSSAAVSDLVLTTYSTLVVSKCVHPSTRPEMRRARVGFLTELSGTRSHCFKYFDR